jgi:hypothetical protein
MIGSMIAAEVFAVIPLLFVLLTDHRPPVLRNRFHFPQATMVNPPPDFAAAAV